MKKTILFITTPRKWWLSPKVVAYAILTLLSFTYCSTVKNRYVQDFSVQHLRKTNLRNVIFSGTIAAVVNGNGNSASYRMSVAGIDSLSLNLMGPFGILIGKLYANPKYFLFYSPMTNYAVDGLPEGSNLKAAVYMPISYYDLVRLIRCETPGNPVGFEPEGMHPEENNSSTTIILKNTQEKDYIEFVSINLKTGLLEQYQRKDKSGKMLFNTYFQDYETFDDFQLATRIIFNFETFEGNVTIEIDKAETNQRFDKPFRFAIPEGIRKYTLD